MDVRAAINSKILLGDSHKHFTASPDGPHYTKALLVNYFVILEVTRAAGSFLFSVIR
jgi:hypothetical protein